MRCSQSPLQDLLSNYPSVTCSHLNVQANMMDALLSLGQYDEVQALLDKYECMNCVYFDITCVET